ncbi:MAG: dihydrolipoyl dehydrogenase family protein [Planctomycetota bacterium]|jgi:dihydrolipoamide dehydrogenase
MVVGEFSTETTLLIVGGGPGGYAAAFRAAELGVPTILVDEREDLGGVCLHEGCVPSKTMLDIARTIETMNAGKRGIEPASPNLDPDAMQRWIDGAVGGLARGLAATAKRLKIDVVQGRATFNGARDASVPGGTVSRIRFRRALIATGASSIQHAQLPFDGERVLRPNDALRPLEGNVLVFGSGYMALELASIHAALGCTVTLATEDDALLPDADPDLTKVVQRSLKQRLAGLTTGRGIEQASVQGDVVNVVMGGAESAYDYVIIAGAQRGNTANLGLDLLDAAPDANGFLAVDDQMRTANPRVFAVGDVTGPPLSAALAMHQGRVAAEVIAGQPSGLDATVVPSVVFTDPPMAWCGLTEHDAKANGISHATRSLRWGASGRAAGMGRTDGVTKIVYDPATQVVLGVGLCGVEAPEMIGEGCLAVEMGAELGDLARTIHAHPTMSELLSDVAREAEASSDGD